MPLFSFDSAQNELANIERTTFQREGITEAQIQASLAKNISPLLSDAIVICVENCPWVDANRRIDLLCLDKDANLIIVELKRDETAAQADLQALRYAAMISTMNFKEVCQLHAQHLTKSRGAAISAEDAESIIRDFLGWSSDEEGFSFNDNVRIVLAAIDFSKELTTTALWLSEKGIEIECTVLMPYKSGDEVFIEIHTLIPVPESDDYRIKLREKGIERAAQRRAGKDYTQYRLNGSKELLNKRRLAYEIISSWVRDKRPESIEILNERFPNSSRKYGGFLVRPRAEAERIAEKYNNPKHYIKTDEGVIIGGDEYCITNQWGLDSITLLIEEAVENREYEIASIKPEI